MPESLQEPVLGSLEWDAVLSRVRAGLERIRSNEPEYRQWTAAQVVDDRWNSEEEMTVQDITALLRLASVDFHPDGGAGLYWNDEDRLYGGHNLITEVDPGGKCVELRIEG